MQTACALCAMCSIPFIVMVADYAPGRLTMCSLVVFIGVGMTCTLGGLIQYHVQFMCGTTTCLIYDRANID